MDGTRSVQVVNCTTMVWPEWHILAVNGSDEHFCAFASQREDFDG